MSNYVLQLELGDGFNKAGAALDSLLKKVGKLSAGSVDFSLDKAIDDSGILKSGENMGEKLSGGIKKSIKKNLSGNWLGLSGEFGAAVQKASKDSAKSVGNFWSDAIKNGAAFQKSQSPPSFKGLRDVGGADLAKVNALPDIGKILEDEAKAKKLDWKKILTGFGLGFSNPYIGSRVLSDELGKKLPAAGAGGGVAGGLFGKGGIAGFSEIFIAFKIFKFAVDLFKSTVENARQMYAKALQSGMGLSFSVKRNALAEIMGVSERDVFRFGAQVAYLNPKLEFATDELAKTTKSLTELSYGLKITGYDFKALSAQFSDAMSPAIGELTDDFNTFLKTLGSSGIIKDIGKELNVALIVLGDVVGLIEVVVMGFVTGLHVIADSFAIAVMTILNLLSKLPGLHGIGGWDTTNAKKDLVNSSQSLADLEGKVSDNFFGKKGGGLSGPQAWMKQLPASSWEKMGLITMGGSQNYAKDTAKNTKEIVVAIKALTSKMSGKPQNSSWGMSPNTAQP